jgi:hypothetical protein
MAVPQVWRAMAHDVVVQRLCKRLVAGVLNVVVRRRVLDWEGSFFHAVSTGKLVMGRAFGRIAESCGLI